MGLFSIPQIQGLNGTTPIEYLQSQFLTGKAKTGTVTVFATEDGTSTGAPLFSAIHHVSAMPATNGLTVSVTPAATSVSVSTDLKSVIASATVADGTVISLAIFGEPVVPADEQSRPPSPSQSPPATQ